MYTKTKRKILPAVVAAAMILSVSGCAKDSKPETKDSSTVTSQTEAPESKAETAEPTESAAPLSESQPGEEKPAVTTAADTDTKPVSGNGNMTNGLTYDPSDNTWATDDEKYEKFIKIMKRECTKAPDFNGIMLLATDDKILFIGASNTTEADGIKKVNAFTTYELGQISSIFTATAVLQLCEQGKLSLDDKLVKYFPGFEKGKDITLEQILSARSGLQPDFLPSGAFYDGKAYNTEALKKYYNDGYAASELLSSLFSSDLLFEPGKDIMYSNAGFTLLAMVIEQVSGMSYADYVKENIFKVCGMVHSGCMTTGDVTSTPVIDPESSMIPFDVTKVSEDGYLAAPNTGKGAMDIHSCASDMLAFDKALMGGKLLNEESLAVMYDLDAKERPFNCGWQPFGYWQPEIAAVREEVYFSTGNTLSYIANNVICKSKKYGNVYFIQMHSNIEDAKYCGDTRANIALATKT